MHDIISLNTKEIITNMAIAWPKYFLMLQIYVSPVTIVYLPKATIRKKVKIHDRRRGQISSIP